MDAFEAARRKYEKNKERQSLVVPVQDLQQKAEPRPAPKVEAKKQGPMVVTVSGPAHLTFEIEYAGALLSSQQTPQALREILSKQLAALGRVTCL
jgi:hypothetical protein